MIKILLISLISIIIFYASSILGKKLGLLDFPDVRKIHKNPTPYTGGLGLILSFFFVIWVLYFDLVLLNIIFTSFFIFTVGFVDDKYKINVGSRILFQLLVIFFFVNNYNLEIKYIIDINDFFKLNLGGLSLIFTILCTIYLINAFNYQDGLDGLVALQIIFILLSLIFFQFYYYKYINYDLLYLILPCFLFMLFNINFFIFPKLFLGNGGSTMLGFIVAFMFIYYGYYSNLNIDPELLIWPLAFIVFEFSSTNLSRIYRNKPLFNPGHDHIHYMFLKKFKSVLKVNLIILLINILFLFIGFFSFMIGDMISIIFFIILFIIYFFLRERLIDSIKEK